MTDKVVASGDFIGQRTLAGVELYSHLNDAGQVAFVARFTDGGSAVVRADPVGAPELLADLLTAVTGVGTGTSLAAKVKIAQRDLAANDVLAACGTLGAFLNEVNAQAGKHLDPAQATSFTSTADEISALLGCR